jgi:hypothetical protein
VLAFRTGEIAASLVRGNAATPRYFNFRLLSFVVQRNLSSPTFPLPGRNLCGSRCIDCRHGILQVVKPEVLHAVFGYFRPTVASPLSISGITRPRWGCATQLGSTCENRPLVSLWGDTENSSQRDIPAAEADSRINITLDLFLVPRTAFFKVVIF